MWRSVVFLSVFVPAAAGAAGAAAGAAANPLLTTHVPATVATHQARRLGAPDPAESMDLAISLPTRNGAALHALLRDLYTQGSPLYRHYLSVPEFTARFGPSAADYAALRDFATAHHLAVTSLAANRRVLGVRGTVADIDAAFHITLGLYQVAGATRSFVAPDREPQIDLAVPVLHISGLDTEILPYTHLVRGDAAAQSRIVATGSHLATGPHLATGSGPHGNFIGSDIRAAYYGGTKLAGAGQSVGLLEYAGYNINDVLNYFKHVEQPFTVPIFGVSLDGANLNCTGKCDDSEQVLDIEEAISMAPSLSKLVVYVGKLDVSMLNQMAVDDSCKQLSSSWGWKADASTIDPILEEFAAQGQSFVDATGDDGYELLKDAVWPGDDQNVTGVGGTDLKTTGPGGKWLAELAWHYSGGGPSPDHILIPAYQVPFITPVNNGNHRLRNVPDIAGDANTDNYSCYDGGCYTGNGGTSYAAPLWAGFIALVNEQAEAAGKPPVGFLNPTIYTLGGSSAYKTVFHDQIYGNNGRYIAEPGFDLTTGFGSPAGQALIDALAGTAAGVK